MSRERRRREVVHIDGDGTEHPTYVRSKAPADELATIPTKDRVLEVTDGPGHLLAVVTAAPDRSLVLSLSGKPEPVFTVREDGFHFIPPIGAPYPTWDLACLTCRTKFVLDATAITTRPTGQRRIVLTAR